METVFRVIIIPGCISTTLLWRTGRETLTLWLAGGWPPASRWGRVGWHPIRRARQTLEWESFTVPSTVLSPRLEGLVRGIFRPLLHRLGVLAITTTLVPGPLEENMGALSKELTPWSGG